MKRILIHLMIISMTLITGVSCKWLSKKEKEVDNKPVKYIAFSSDTEAYFTSPEFENFQGIFTQDIIDVCDKYNIPFTWLIVIDKDHKEVRNMAEKHFPDRKNIDEFSLHSHFKWFIMDHPDDFESFKKIDRRINWLQNAKDEIINTGLPMPLSFRYGGGDSNERFYCIEDLMFLIDEMGIRNFLFSADRLQDVKGINVTTHLGNNVWEIDGNRKLTLLSTCIFLDKDQETVVQKVNECLENNDYALIGCHDYREIVPVNMEKVILHLNEKYNVKYVTIDQIGELIRQNKIKNQ